MTPTLRARAVDGIPSGTRVRHYDELAEEAKATFPAVATGGPMVVAPELAAGFRNGEIVKFTDYYRIDVLDDPVSARADSPT